MEVSTPDLWDQHHDGLRYLDVSWIHFGMVPSFCGEVVTLKAFEDNTWVRKLLSENGGGKVLVIDGGGSRRCALVGDRIAQLAIDNQWAGLVVYGCIRDSAVIKEMNIGIKALGTCPVKSIKRDVGYARLDLLINGCVIKAGDYLYADMDGILISPNKLF